MEPASTSAPSAAPAPPHSHDGSADASGSNASSCSGLYAGGSDDLSAQLDAAQRTHHLLKHCLSHDQRGEALLQFGTTDVREAAKEISRMGQRELQGKFRVSGGPPRAWGVGGRRRCALAPPRPASPPSEPLVNPPLPPALTPRPCTAPRRTPTTTTGCAASCTRPSAPLP